MFSYKYHFKTSSKQLFYCLALADSAKYRRGVKFFLSPVYYPGGIRDGRKRKQKKCNKVGLSPI